MAALLSSTLLLSFFFFFSVPANAAFLKTECRDGNGNYTADSAYKNNLNLILSNLSTLSTTQNLYNGGFFNLSGGGVNALALCRGDVAPADCYSCLNDSTVDILTGCPNQKEAIILYDSCMLRYSDRPIFGVAEDTPELVLMNVNNVSSVDDFNRVVSSLLSNLSTSAASGASLRKFAAGSARYSDFQTIYALVQCTPDLSQIDCNNCLIREIGDLPGYFRGKIGGRIVRPSCFFMYDNRLFYNDPPPTLAPESPPSTDTSTGNGDGGTSQSTVVIIVLVVVVAVVLILCICIGVCIFLKKRKTKKFEVDPKGAKGLDEMASADSLEIDFGTIRDATDNFSDANKLGQGGFGSVYKGKLSDGQDIAVKRLSHGSGQGDLEFKNEVVLVAKLQHRNLVKLLGFCLESDERLLIYEFMPNVSLDYFLFDPVKREQLNWEIRYKIIGGTARGLVYLHEDSRLRIIHRDMKASNILLDAEMNPKIADFGMARLFIRDQTQGATSRIVGTYGYMAPEYAMYGHFSVKSDVFSFGVLVLEIVSGQRNNSFRCGENVEDLLSYTWRNWREGTPSNIIDPLLRTSAMSEMMRCIHIALLCVQHNVADRPTMNTVVLMLNSYSLTLPVPLQPAFFADSSSEYSGTFSSQRHLSGQSEVDRARGKTVQFAENEASMSTYILRDENV